MAEKVVMITNKVGLHARPAALLVKTAGGFKCEITLTKGEKTISAKSMLAVMSAGIKLGDAVTVRAAGEDETAALEAVVNLIESGFGEK